MNPPRFITHEGVLIAVDDVKYAYEVPEDPTRRDAPTAHLHIEYKHGGWTKHQNLTVAGLASLLNGAAF